MLLCVQHCARVLSVWKAHSHTLNLSFVLLCCSETLVRGREGERLDRVHLPRGLSPPMSLDSSSGRVHRTATHYKRYICILVTLYGEGGLLQTDMVHACTCLSSQSQQGAHVSTHIHTYTHTRTHNYKIHLYDYTRPSHNYTTTLTQTHSITVTTTAIRSTTMTVHNEATMIRLSSERPPPPLPCAAGRERQTDITTSEVGTTQNFQVLAE